MSDLIVTPSRLSGNLRLPSSKSETLRALLFSCLAEGRSTIRHALCSPDREKMVHACKLFGATLEEDAESIVVHGIAGKVVGAKDVIDAGNSGIVLRFCTAIGALAKSPVVITGDASIRNQRPLGPLLAALDQLGVRVETLHREGFAPVVVRGPILPGKVRVDGRDSQPVSALLIAAALASGPIEISVEEPGETPWVDLTLKWLQRLGIPFEQQGHSLFLLEGGASYCGFDYSVPGDLSSAAFPIAAALVTGSELLVENIDLSQPQGDKELLYLFQRMGAEFQLDEEKKQLKVLPSARLKGVEADINGYIDGIAALAAVACYAEGETLIYNAENARHKECDRVSSLAVELRKMGANVEERRDGLLIIGGKLQGAALDSHDDHRMALALSVAALGASGESVISGFHCCSKTYPGFVESIQKCGGVLQESACTLC